jgi:hypothetical protein
MVSTTVWAVMGEEMTPVRVTHRKIGRLVIWAASRQARSARTGTGGVVGSDGKRNAIWCSSIGVASSPTPSWAAPDSQMSVVRRTWSAPIGALGGAIEQDSIGTGRWATNAHA